MNSPSPPSNWDLLLAAGTPFPLPPKLSSKKRPSILFVTHFPSDFAPAVSPDAFFEYLIFFTEHLFKRLPHGPRKPFAITQEIWCISPWIPAQNFVADNCQKQGSTETLSGYPQNTLRVSRGYPLWVPTRLASGFSKHAAGTSINSLKGPKARCAFKNKGERQQKCTQMCKKLDCKNLRG